MKRILAALAVATAFGVLTMPAHAVPPTATPSPGYDARLQESRSAGTVYVPAVKPAKPPRKKRAQ